jgi:type IV pilus assembly protein PilB
VHPSSEILADLELSPSDVKGKQFYRGKGCDNCNRTGYKGRVGLFELMLLDDEIRDMIIRNASTDELREKARRMGMVSLRDAGMEAVYAGTTTAEEVIRETILEA